MARFYMKFDKDKNELIVEVTQDIAFSVMKSLRVHLWPEIEHRKLEIVDWVNDEGFVYKGLRRYTIPIYEDRVEHYFEAAKMLLRKNIQYSIVNSDN